MAWNDTALNTGAAAMTAAYPYLSLHTTGAVTSSTNESTAARVAASWSAPATGGDVTVTSKAFTGGAASGPVVRVGYWSAATAGTYGGGSLLTGDQAFNAAGAYTVNSITETATQS
jgi:hypothetical protein